MNIKSKIKSIKIVINKTSTPVELYLKYQQIKLHFMYIRTYSRYKHKILTYLEQNKLLYLWLTT